MIADRHFGIGCDQILLVEPARLDRTDFHYRIFNSDGGEVEQCGSGARCFARYVREQGLSEKSEIPVGTSAGRIVLRVEADGLVCVDMGKPELRPESIPFIWPEQAVNYPLEVKGEVFTISAVSMGNLHAVLLVDSVDQAPVARLGPEIERHGRFPRRVNVGFMQQISESEIRLRVFERGTGETLACGTGACAAVVAGRLQGLLAERVRVHLRGGALMIEWSGEGYPVMMCGPAETVYEGSIEL
jgi:diaminopimelate epimerase